MTIANTNAANGIRYGVIACASLDDDLVFDLMYGSKARNLSEAAAVEEARVEANYKANDIEAEVAQDLHEKDPLMPVLAYEEQLKAWIEAAYESLGHADREDFIESKLIAETDWQCEEPHIAGEYEGVKYEIQWLGGAPLLWVIDGPLGYCRKLCSPCVPNAGDLDSGFIGRTLATTPQRYHDRVPQILQEGYLTHVIPPDWLRD